MQWTENKKKTNWQRTDQHNEFIDIQTTSVSQNCLTHVIINELLIQIRHFRGATRTDENVTVKQLHCAQRCFWEMIWNNFFHQLLVLWIIHVVLSLTSRLVCIFSSTMLSFVSTYSLTIFRVSTSSAIAIRMLPVFRFSYTSSTLAHHWLQNCASSVKHIHYCLLLHRAISGFNRPIIDSFQISRLAIDQPSTCFQIRMIDQLSTHFQISFVSFSNSFASFPNEPESRWVWILDPFWPDPLTSGVQRSPAQSARLVLNHFWNCWNCWKISKDPGLSAADYAATGQPIKMFIIMHPSRRSPSFVVVVIAATISDQHVLTTREFCVLAMVSWVFPMDSSHQQQHPTSSDQMSPGSATTSDMSATASDVHRSHVFLQHSLLLSCHCRLVHWNIDHPVLVMWSNSRARARFSNQSVVLSFSA